jgi:predicted LPLAT superfamily acyltransferase
MVALVQGQALPLMQNCVTHQRRMAKHTKCSMWREKTKHHVAYIDLKLSKYASWSGALKQLLDLKWFKGNAHRLLSAEGEEHEHQRQR